MNARGTTQLDVARANLWLRLSDPRTLEDVLPSIQSVERHDDDSFAVHIEPQTGLGSTPLHLEVAMLDRKENEHVRLQGSGRGGEYATSFEIEIDLDENAGGTEVRWSAEASVDGVLGSLGQRVLPMILTSQVQQVLRASAAAAQASVQA